MPPEMETQALYPSPPWTLQGEGLILFRFPHIHKIDKPPIEGLRVQSVFPGRTLSGYYIAKYDTTLSDQENSPWHEWGNISYLGNRDGMIGLIISAMAVDSQAALLGGREVWGLQKFLAQIQFSANDAKGTAYVSTPLGNTALDWKEWGPAVRMSRANRFLTILQGLTYHYTVLLSGRFRFCRIEVLEQGIAEFSTIHSGRYYGLRFMDAQISIDSPMK